jgi:P-type E1-E2 ATPase
MRNGAEETIHHNSIQVGDILKIKAGMNIPVDGVILRSSGVQCNESAMTGESVELKKDTIENCDARQEEKDAEYAYLKSDAKSPTDLPSSVLLSGTQIATGEGWFVCIVVGKYFCVGKILGKLEQKIETKYAIYVRTRLC